MFLSVFCFLFCFDVAVHGSHRRPLGGIISVCETPQLLQGLEKARASIHQVVSCKWVKYKLWMNYPFSTHFFDWMMYIIVMLC